MNRGSAKQKTAVRTKIADLVAIVAISAMVISNMGYTGSYYSDTETSQSNSFTASFLDFEVTDNDFDSIIGPEVLGEKSHASVVFPVSGSLEMKYSLGATTTSDTTGLCGKIIVEAKLNGLTKYNGPLNGLAYATSSEFGSWEFRFDLPPDQPAAHGDKCDLETIFTSWRSETNGPEESGYFDEEKISFSFTARMVVLNEIYPRPSSGMKEFVEIYNNGSTAVDVAGWKISELTASGSTTLHTIVASGASGSQMQPDEGTTLIQPYGFITLKFGGSNSYFNDNGDTVGIRDLFDNLLDSHAYGSVGAGKALVRMPDGIGYWVDPEPTPGMPNMVTLEDLRIAGFDDATILEIMEMMLLRSSLICENASVQTQTTIEEKNTESTGGGTEQNPETISETTEATTTPEVIIEIEEAATTTPEIITSTSTEESVIVNTNIEKTESQTPVIEEQSIEAPTEPVPALEEVTEVQVEAETQPTEPIS